MHINFLKKKFVKCKGRAAWYSASSWIITSEVLRYGTFSRISVLPARPHVHPRSEWAIPAFAFPAVAGTHLPTPEGWKAELAWDPHSPYAVAAGLEWHIFGQVAKQYNYGHKCLCNDKCVYVDILWVRHRGIWPQRILHQKLPHWEIFLDLV